MFPRFFKTILGVLLLPAAIATAQTFYEDISGISIMSGSLRLIERGVLIYLIFHLMVMRPVYLYVLGHEFVHVLAAWICGGKVVSFNVKPSGGSVVTNKTNFFIELSPYFIPIYTVLLGPVFLILQASGVGKPYMSAIFLFLVGVTLAFHFTMTSEVLRMEQPDIIKSGVIFSMVIIFTGNLIITMAVFCPMFDHLSFIEFVKGATNGTIDMYARVYGYACEGVQWVAALMGRLR